MYQLYYNHFCKSIICYFSFSIIHFYFVGWDVNVNVYSYVLYNMFVYMLRDLIE